MKKLLIFLLMLSFIPFISAEEDDDLDLGSILSEAENEVNQNVVVAATKKTESIKDSPGIITVLTRQQIEEIGAKSLYELLSYVPGVELTETYFGYTSVNFRGLLQTHYNNKSLLLINGHPFIEVVNGSHHLEMIPTQSIKKIEVIRGPGSTLYGTNAFAGVINIILKDGSEYEKNRVSIGTGSFSNSSVGFDYGNFDNNNNSSYYFSGNFIKNKGFEIDLVKEFNTDNAKFNYQNDNMNFFYSFSKNDFKFNAGFFKQEKMQLTLKPTGFWNGPATYQGFFLDGFLKKKINDSSSYSLRLRVDSMERNIDIGEFPVPSFTQKINGDTSTVLKPNGNMYGIEFQYDKTINSKYSIINGFTFEKFNSGEYPFELKNGTAVSDGSNNSPFSAWLEKYDYNNIAIFHQSSYYYNDNLTYIGGIRFTKNSDSGNDISPKLGGVYKINKATNFKFMYGEAFRAPDFFEKYVNTAGVLYGDKDLKPEKIKTVDLAVDYTTKSKMDFRANYFYFTVSDYIGRFAVNQSDNAPKYANEDGTRKYNGIELEYRGNVKDNIYFFSNYSYKVGKDKNNDEIKSAAKHISNLGLTYKYNKFTFSPLMQYIGKRVISSADQTDKTIDAQNIFNINTQYKHNNKLEYRFLIKNLLDENIQSPQYVYTGSKNKVMIMPADSGRAFYLDVNYKF